MGKKMDELNALKHRRDLLMRTEKRILTFYGAEISGLSAEVNKIHRQAEIERVDRKIKALEAEAQKEQEQEITERVMKDATNAATQAGKEIAAAFEKGFNSR